MAFSCGGLVEHLVYDGHTTEQAEFGVNGISIDWNEQAAKSAESFLDYSAFSLTGLTGQLLHQGFSQARAEYGVNAGGL